MHTVSDCAGLRHLDDGSLAEQEQERKSRIKGLEAQKANIRAAKAVARVMRSSMGPKGMDKMLQSPDGDIVISARGGRLSRPSAIAPCSVVWSQQSPAAAARDLRRSAPTVARARALFSAVWTCLLGHEGSRSWSSVALRLCALRVRS